MASQDFRAVPRIGNDIPQRADEAPQTAMTVTTHRNLTPPETIDLNGVIYRRYFPDQEKLSQQATLPQLTKIKIYMRNGDVITVSAIDVSIFMPETNLSFFRIMGENTLTSGLIPVPDVEKILPADSSIELAPTQERRIRDTSNGKDSTQSEACDGIK